MTIEKVKPGRETILDDLRGRRGKKAGRGLTTFVWVAVVVITLAIIGGSYYDEYTLDHSLQPAQHLQQAKLCLDTVPALAYRHLKAIPSNSPEHSEVPALLAVLSHQEKAAREKQEAEAAKEAPQREQKKRDEDAEVWSYWPTTLRVDTDMDSFWLKNEERTCETYPNVAGKIAIVACNSTGSHQNHNIPVKFWGGVNRNIVSRWRCRRESDDFVCKAID
jgi:hypothetical protein